MRLLFKLIGAAILSMMIYGTLYLNMNSEAPSQTWLWPFGHSMSPATWVIWTFGFTAIAILLMMIFGMIYQKIYSELPSWLWPFGCNLSPFFHGMVCFLTGLVAGCVLMFLIHNPTMEHEAPSPNPTVKSEVPSPNPTVKHESPSPNPTVKHEAPSPKQTLILMWLWPFGVKFDIDSCRSTRFDIDGCKLTDDRKMYNNADAVLFHHREIRSDLSNMPPSQRPPFQKWVWMNFEPPSNSPKIPGLRNLFNLTLNYRLDADITLLSGKFIPKKGNSDFKIPNKDELVCWVVSNWNEKHLRVEYYHKLKEHIDVHGYGRAFNKPVAAKGLLPLIARCKFYLAFENSNYTDYTTEKLFNPLSEGTVPVVLGTSRQNYERRIPGDAFIHVDDFPSPKELAEHIRFLDKNVDAYRQYFNWHKHYEVQKHSTWTERICAICDHVKKQKEYETVNNLDEWYWG